MNEWVIEVKKSFGLEIDCDIKAILDVARVAAHSVERPAAPVTTFLMGVAFANGCRMDELIEKVDALAKDWPVKER